MLLSPGQARHLLGIPGLPRVQSASVGFDSPLGQACASRWELWPRRHHSPATVTHVAVGPTAAAGNPAASPGHPCCYSTTLFPWARAPHVPMPPAAALPRPTPEAWLRTLWLGQESALATAPKACTGAMPTVPHLPALPARVLGAGRLSFRGHLLLPAVLGGPPRLPSCPLCDAEALGAGLLLSHGLPALSTRFLCCGGISQVSGSLGLPGALALSRCKVGSGRGVGGEARAFHPHPRAGVPPWPQLHLHTGPLGFVQGQLVPFPSCP